MTNTNTSCDIIERKNKRVWINYRPSLVKRIDVLINTSLIDSWKDDVEKENRGKVFYPYEYQQELFVFLSKVMEQRAIPFMEMEEFVRNLSKITDRLCKLSYIAVFHIMRRIPMSWIMEEINQASIEGMTVVIDS